MFNSCQGGIIVCHTEKTLNGYGERYLDQAAEQSTLMCGLNFSKSIL